jgi:hypothetical protein
MKKFAYIAAVLCVLLICGAPFAEAQSSAKATGKCADLNILSVSQSDVEGEWQLILFNTIKTSEQKDMNVDVSLECGLLTRTVVKSKGGNKDTSIAEGSVKVVVVVDAGTEDERVMDPGEVTFCRRTQELSAVFQGLLTDEDGNVCLSSNPLTGAITIDEECLRPEEVDLLLDTMNANSFNFILDDLGSGVHSVSVYAKVDLSTESMEGSAEAKALIGKGSMAVEEIRFIKSEDIAELP